MWEFLSKYPDSLYDGSFITGLFTGVFACEAHIRLSGIICLTVLFTGIFALCK